jgi:hypothetical protein
MSETITTIPKIIPKQENRFFVKFPKPFNIHKMATNKVSPLVYNCEKNEWEDILLDLYDGAMSVCRLKEGQQIETETFKTVSYSILKAFQTLTKDKATKKITLFIEKLDPTGYPIEVWSVKGYIKNVSFGDLNYNSDKVSNVKITFKVDKASLKIK